MTVVGVLLVLGGLALMVLPGPGILLAVAGLAVLATEYVWARRILGRAQKEAEKAQAQAVASPARTVATVVFALGTVAVGVSMIVVEDVPWPVWDSVLDSVWRPLTGSILILTGVILLTTTALALHGSRQRRPSMGPGDSG